MNELLGQALELLRNAWRFRWRGLAVAWLVALGGWLFVYSMPDEYDVQARVHIDTRSAIHPLLSGMAVMPDVKQQVDFLIQTVLSRPNLEDIARRTGLDIKATTPEAEDDLLDRLGKNIHIRTIGNKINLYGISFSSSDADTARAVVQQVINIMTTMALGDSGGDSEQAISFLTREADNYKGKLTSLENKMATFKKENADLMPGRNDYVSRLQSLQAELSGLEDQLSAATNRRDSARQQAGALSGGGSRRVPVEQSQQVRAIDSQLEQRRQQLTQMLTRYTDEYPDVVSLKREIERLQQTRADTIVDLQRHPERVAVANSSGYDMAQQSYASANSDVKTLQTQIGRKKDRIESLKAGADDMTDAQAKLAELSRDYEVTKDQYDKLVTRLYSARLSNDVEKSGNRIQFGVVDPPETPAEPTGPARALLMSVVLVAALGAGAVFSFFMSQIRPVFINRRSLTDFTGLPVLGSISMAWSTRQKMRRQTALVFFLAGIGTLVLGYFGAVALAPMGSDFVPTFLSNQWL